MSNWCLEIVKFFFVFFSRSVVWFCKFWQLLLLHKHQLKISKNVFCFWRCLSQKEQQKQHWCDVFVTIFGHFVQFLKVKEILVFSTTIAQWCIISHTFAIAIFFPSFPSPIPLLFAEGKSNGNRKRDVCPEQSAQMTWIRLLGLLLTIHLMKEFEQSEERRRGAMLVVHSLLPFSGSDQCSNK